VHVDAGSDARSPGRRRPFLVRRSNRVLNGEQGPRSRAHHAYVALEVVKVLALVSVTWAALRPV